MHESGIDYSAIIEDTMIRQAWEKRWHQEQQGWDIGYASPAISEYLRQYNNKEAAVLVPGCGNAWEADFMIKEGFTNINLMDIAPTVTNRLREKFKDNPEVKVISANFFAYQGKFDLILEQTFFCAIDPAKRQQYAVHAAELLNEGGKAAGLLFNKKFEKQGPPFGGDKEEYEAIFSLYFNILRLEESKNSIEPRKGSELFFEFEKKADMRD